jgi:hypothetical protein
MRAFSEQNLHVQHVFHRQVARVGSFPGDFAACIDAREGMTDGRVHNHKWILENHFPLSFIRLWFDLWGWNIGRPIARWSEDLVKIAKKDRHHSEDHNAYCQREHQVGDEPGLCLKESQKG